MNRIAEQDRHRRHRVGGVLRFGRLERGHAVGDRLDARQRHGPTRERLEEQEDGDRLERVRVWLGVRLGWRDDRPADDVDQADGDDAEGEEHEQIGRDREDVPGLAQAAQVGDGDQRDGHERDLDPEVVGGRDDRLDLGDRRCGRDRDRHHVVDQQGGCRDQPEDRRQVGLGHDVGAAAVRVGATDLPVRDRHDRQQDRDGDRDLERQDQRAGAGHQQHAQDLLGRIGRRADRVRAEDGQGLGLGQPFADLLLGRQRAAEDHRAHPVDQPSARCQGDVGRGLGDQRVGAHVPEIGGVGAFDPDAPVRRLATPQGPPPTDHMRTPLRLGRGMKNDSDGCPVRVRPAMVTERCQTPTRRRSARRSGRPADRIAAPTPSTS